ncbi:MAG: TatD family hydrolase, partial [Victivallales bacterium]|nr:TatD family hydrolase [Victivallales bacterium]
MVWFDTHFHISPEKEVLAESMLAEARTVGVRHFLIQGTSLEDCPVAARIARREDGAMATVGLHPEAVEEFTDLTPWRALLAAPRVVAVGEIGLDYHYGAETAELQRQVFAAFLRLAADTGLPAVIHCRDAFQDCLALVKANLPSGHPFVI